jgi:acetylornithine deacetylase/succinyl-diaminopimelate desuccinylase-like protein
MDKDDLKLRAIKILTELLAVESLSGQEERFIQLLSERLRERGFEVKLQRVENCGGNLLAQRGKSPLLFATHLDTVPSWEHPHYLNPRVSEDKIFGRGAIDSKGQIGALLLASELTKDPMNIALFCDEEKGGRGSKAFTVPEGIRWALVLEPTNLRLAICQAGWVEVRVKVKGKSAHGAVVQKGKNAIEAFFEVWNKVLELPFFTKEDPLFPGIKPNLGKISGGIDPQLVPKECEALIDFPVLPGFDPQEVLEGVRKTLKAFEAEVVEIIDIEPPWQMEREDEPFFQIIKEAWQRAFGEELKICGMPAWTDALSLRQKGISAFVLGAGELHLAHTEEEHIHAEEMLKLSKLILELTKIAKEKR